MLDPATTIVTLGAIIWGLIAILPIFAILANAMRTPAEQEAQVAWKSRTERMLGL